MVRWRTWILLVSLPAVGLAVGCLAGPERTYFDDLMDGSADATSDRTTRVEAALPGWLDLAGRDDRRGPGG